MSYNTPKIINVFYKEDRKPYDVNGKAISYFGEDFIGANDATKIRFYFLPNQTLNDLEGIIHAKRADGQIRFEILTASSDTLGNYFELPLNAWFTSKVGKVTLSLKVYTGDITYGYTGEEITSIESIADAVVVASDIFTLNIGYAPDASDVVPAFEEDYLTQIANVLLDKPDFGETIYVVPELPTLTGGVFDNQWFLVKTTGNQGKLYHIVGSTAEEAILEYDINDLQDVNTTIVANGDILRFDTATSKYVNTNALSTAEGEIDTLQSEMNAVEGRLDVVEPIVTTNSDEIDTLQSEMDLVEGRLDVVEPIVEQHTTDISDLDERIDFIEDNGGIDFIKVADFASLPTSGDVRNHRLFLTQDTNKLYEFDGTSFNEVRQDKLTADSGEEDGFLQVGGGTLITHSGVSDATALQVFQTSILGEGAIIEASNATGIQFAVNKDGSVNAYGDLTIAGNLTVSGTTTTVNTAVLDVEDNIITINKNQTGTPETTLLSGIEVERGDQTNFQFVFQESSDLFKVGQVGDLQAVATREDSPTDKGVAFFNTSTNKFETSDNLKVNTSGQLEDVVVRNSGTTAVPLVVNSIASTTADLQSWQLNGSTLARINNTGRIATVGFANPTNGNNSFIEQTNNGLIMGRNIADANSSLIVNLQNASSTGNIANFQFAGANKLEVTKDGFLNQNGVRLFHQTGGTTNTFFGNVSGGTSTTGISNTGFGLGSLFLLTSGTNNTAVGRSALQNNTSGGVNTAVGNNALFTNTTGNFNVAVGEIALTANTTGQFNTGLGRSSLSANTTGNGNTGVGINAGSTITTGGQNTFVGINAGVTGQLATAVNSTALGQEAFTDKSNQMVFGNASVTEFKFDRNTGATLLAPRITSFSTANLGVPQFFAENTNANSEVSFGTKNDGGIFTVLGSYGSTKSSYGITGSNDSFLYSNGIELNIVSDNSNGTIKFGTGGSGSTERMRITNTGNVGIGTTNPTERLQIGTNFQVTSTGVTLWGNNSENGALTWDTGKAIIGGRTGNALDIRTNNTTKVHITTDGNVGIGTTAPDKRLEVRTPSGTETSFRLRQSEQNFWDFLVPTSNTSLTIGDVSGEKLRITSAGNVGIGTTTPADKLHSVSNSNGHAGFFQKTAGFGSAIQLKNTSTSSTDFIRFINSSDAIISQIQPTTNGINFVGSATVGLIGINEGTPTAQLQVKSGATSRVPLIVDTLASHATNLQEWKVNGTILARVEVDGGIKTLGIRNPTADNNSVVGVGNNGTSITRNINDSNPTLIVNNVNATNTADITRFQKAGVTQSLVASNGVFVGQARPTKTDITANATLALVDEGKVLRVNSASNLTITIPLNSSVAFPIDTEIAVLRYGTGTVSISPTSGVTLNSKNAERKISGQYGSVALKKIGTDEWVLVGSLEA
jgi:hypothetical protein